MAHVDFEPVAVLHSQELLADVPGATITSADVRDTASVIAAPTVTDVIDFARPVAVLAVGILHFISDADDPVATMAAYRQALAPGSIMALCHVSDDHDDPALVRRVVDGVSAYRDSATPSHLRSRARIREMLGDLPLVEPGLVDVNEWRPDDAMSESDLTGLYAGVARV